jgi:hypothetical protein
MEGCDMGDELRMAGGAPATPDEAPAGEVMTKNGSANAAPMRKLVPTTVERAATLKSAKEMAQSFLSPTAPPARHDWKSHAKRINESWQKGVEAIINTGRMLIEAKAELPHGEFTTMVQLKLNFDPDTAQRLMKIAGDEVLSNTAHARYLPSSWMTLYELTKLPSDTLKTALAEGTVNPKTQRKDVAAMLPAKRAPENHQQKSTAAPPSTPQNLEVIEPLTLRVATRHSTVPLHHPKAQALPKPTDPTATAEEANEANTKELPKKIQQSNLANVFMMNCYASVQVAHYSGPVDDKVIKACRKAAQAWTVLLTQLEEQTI